MAPTQQYWPLNHWMENNIKAPPVQTTLILGSAACSDSRSQKAPRPDVDWWSHTMGFCSNYVGWWFPIQSRLCSVLVGFIALFWITSFLSHILLHRRPFSSIQSSRTLRIQVGELCLRLCDLCDEKGAPEVLVKGYLGVPANHRWKWSSVRITRGSDSGSHICRLCFFCFFSMSWFEGASTGNHVVWADKDGAKTSRQFPSKPCLETWVCPKKRVPKKPWFSVLSHLNCHI